MIEVKAGPTGNIATIARYTYDQLGRRTQLAYGPTAGSPVSSITYAYEDDDDLVRLEHRFNSGAVVKVLRHAYDKSGKLKSSAANDTAWAPLPPVATPDNRTYVANVLDQYTSLTVSGQAAATLTYDQNGNLTSDGTWTFAYDAENRLLSATKAGSSVTYSYDALGRRQTKTVNGTLTNYLSAGDEEIAEYDGSNNLLRRYIPGPGTDQPVTMVIVSGTTNTNRYFHADRQGSILAMADATGALIEGPYTYDPYGNSASSTAGVPFRYTGRRLDPETGLYYYRARYYSASLGRFLQTDPVGYDDQMNSFAYVGNDPVNLNDPLGLYIVENRQDRGTINQAVKDITAARDALPADSPERADLDEVLRELGPESTTKEQIARDNVVIRLDGNLGKPGTAGFDKKTGKYVITLNTTGPKGISEQVQSMDRHMRGRSGVKFSSEIAAVLGHEGRHVTDMVKGIRDVSLLERNGYLTQSRVNQGLNSPSAWGWSAVSRLWYPGISNYNRDRVIGVLALKSELSVCGGQLCP